MYKQANMICMPNCIHLFALIINCAMIMKTKSWFSWNVYAINDRIWCNKYLRHTTIEKYENNGKGGYFRFDDDNNISYRYILSICMIFTAYVIQIKICAEYWDMLPRPRLVCQEPGLRPIGRSPGVPDKSVWFLRLIVFKYLVASHVAELGSLLTEPCAVIKFSHFSSHPGTCML